MSTTYRYDRCSECLGEFRVKKDGTLGWHCGDKYVGRWRQVCEGVGKPPAILDNPPAGFADRHYGGAS